VAVSVCCLTADPGPRVAALLEQLRPVVDEIVVAADSRADGDRLRHYAACADVLLRFEMGAYDRHLAWLHDRCSGDWILRMDGDEVASPGFVEQLPALTAARDVEQYLLPRRWLFPDADHWLDELPWWPDYQVRLVRNSGLLRFPGLQHTGPVPVRPARYLDTPLYHLACLLRSEDERRGHGDSYEDLRPGLQAPGGGPLNERFYLPERHATRGPSSVPEDHRAAIGQVLHAAPRGHLPELGELPVVPRSDSERLWAERHVDAGAYHAEIHPFEPDYRMACGERRELHFRIVNRGTEHWSWDPDLKPLIRASCRWWDPDGPLLEPEGPRTSFPCAVAPGESVVLPLDVRAPTRAGTYSLEVDLVHENVRWFDVPLRVTVRVTDNGSGGG